MNSSVTTLLLPTVIFLSLSLIAGEIYLSQSVNDFRTRCCCCCCCCCCWVVAVVVVVIVVVVVVVVVVGVVVVANALTQRPLRQ